ncbi:hypothetical protein ACFVT1_15385 [Streptomyces sp. NPDC057963]|uniref:hypothetical protein n=1 Tax=Streptomyces sp. NPDC057963 TaxID=3346290 RepID=UPI0036E3C2D2
MPRTSARARSHSSASASAALIDSLEPAVVGLAMTRPATSLRIRQALEAGAPGFAAIQDSINGCPDAEVRPGRLADSTDAASIALALAGTVHHLLMISRTGAPDPRNQAGRLVALLVGEAPGGVGARNGRPRPLRGTGSGPVRTTGGHTAYR